VERVDRDREDALGGIGMIVPEQNRVVALAPPFGSEMDAGRKLLEQRSRRLLLRESLALLPRPVDPHRIVPAHQRRLARQDS